MPKATYIQTNFTSGEMSPRLEGRVDISKYINGCKTIENMVVMPHGGVQRRGGSRYVADVKTHSKQVRLYPFEFSVTQAYVIEFGDQYIRFYKDGGQIESGGSPVEVASPYLEAELFELQFTQSADVLFIAHPNHEPRTLNRTSDTSWTLSVYELIAGPLLTENSTSTTLTPSGTTGSITITASAITGINNDTGFQSSDVGRIVQIDHSGTLGHAKITGITSTTVVNADVQDGRDFGAATAQSGWALGYFYTDNWPATVAFYEQRLVWAGSTEYPQLMAFSQSGDYPNHLAGSNDDEAMVYTIATDQVNVIRWLNPGDVLVVGTAGGEFLVSASDQNEALTPTNVRVTRQTTYGGYNTMSKRVSNVVLFMQRAQRKLREFVYRFESDTFVAPDLTLLSEHVTESGITEFDYQQEPDSQLWLVRTDGTLLCCTYQRDQEVVAWTRHILGGVSDSGGTQAKVESVAVIPATAADGAGRDEVYVAVQRYIDSSTVRFIERIDSGLESSEDQEDAFFVDSGLTYDSTPVSSVSGLNHLEGEEVAVLADGAVQSNKTVSSGAITLDNSASVVHVGLPYTSKLVTLNMEAGSADGTAQSKTKRIAEVTVRLYRSLGLKIGPEGGNLDTVPFRSSADAMGTPPALFTGDKTAPYPQGYETSGNVEIRQDQPLPQTILALVMRVKTNN